MVDLSFHLAGLNEVLLPLDVTPLVKVFQPLQYRGQALHSGLGVVIRVPQLALGFEQLPLVVLRNVKGT